MKTAEMRNPGRHVIAVPPECVNGQRSGCMERCCVDVERAISWPFLVSLEMIWDVKTTYAKVRWLSEVNRFGKFVLAAQRTSSLSLSRGGPDR